MDQLSSVSHQPTQQSDADLEALVRGDSEAIDRLISKALTSHYQNQWRLNEKQQDAVNLLGGPQRHTLLVGGARSAKTTLLVRCLIVRAIKGQLSGHGGRHIILRKQLNLVRSSVFEDTFRKASKLFFLGPDGKLAFSWTWNGQDCVVRLWADKAKDPAEIWFGGLDDKERVDKILGKEFITIFYNECSEISWHSVEVADTRLAQVVPGLTQRSWYDLNPVGKNHWTYRLFIEKKHPETRQPLADPDNYQHQFLNPLDNAENLSREYLAGLMRKSERYRRRFFSGEYVSELENALWTYELLDRTRRDVAHKVPTRRVCIAVDPSGCEGREDERSDQIGLIAAALGHDRHGYVLDDQSNWYSPEQWATKVLQMRDRWEADIIIAERNYGGDMVRAVIQAKDKRAKVKLITASRGKHVRAEPISAYYDQDLVHHVGRFDELEEELTNFTTAGYEGPKSPNRADALVFALSELMPPQGEIRTGTVQGLH